MRLSANACGPSFASSDASAFCLRREHRVHRLAEGHVEAEERCLLRRADGEGGALHDLPRPALRRGHQLAGRHDFVDEAPAGGLLRRHVLAGEHVTHRDLEGNRPRQSVHAAGAGKDAACWLWQAEAGAVGGDDDVAGHRQLAAAAEGVAVYGGDDRLPELALLPGS